MPALADIAAMMKKDPVRGFIGIPIAAASAPNAKKVKVTFRTGKGEVVNTIFLPDWTGNDWFWWGEGAWNFASMSAKNAGDRGVDDIKRALDNFAPLHDKMHAKGAAKPAESEIAAYYDKAVRLVIAGKNAAPPEPMIGPIFSDMFNNAPANILASLSWLGDASASAAAAIGREAGNIAGALFGGLLKGLGPVAIGLIGLGLYWYFNRRRQDDGEEA